MPNRPGSKLKALLKRILPPSHSFVSTRFAEIERAVAQIVTSLPLSPQLQHKVLPVIKLLEPEAVAGYRKVRVGGSSDGGYVQIDDYAGISCALSFGIADNDQWDLAVAKLGIPVEQFDHSVESAPSKHPLLHFHRKMITAHDSPDTATLRGLVSSYSKFSGQPDLILKIDIEGWEWEVFDQVPETALVQFTQIICEFHSLSRLENAQFRDRAYRVLMKLTKYFAPVHVHANNAGTLCNVGNIPLPDLMEVTFASRLRYNFTESTETFPTTLDAPNIVGIADIALGTFRFTV